MNPSQAVKPEVLLSIPRVARLMDLPSEAVRRAFRGNQLREEARIDPRPARDGPTVLGRC